MEARVLKEGDVQHTLSTIAKNAKKQKKNVRSVRNTLNLPFQQFWPEVQESDVEQIKTLLEELLPAAKIVRGKPLEWNVIKKMSREERRALRRELNDSTQVPEESKYLLAGHRNVSHAAEESEASCCILTSDINPRFMMSGILSACQHNKTPIIVLPSLQDVTRSTLGFAATALAFKKCVAESKDNKFYPVYKQVKKLWKKLKSSDIDVISKSSNDVPSESPKEPTSENKVTEEETDESETDEGNAKVETEDKSTGHVNRRIETVKKYEMNPEPYKYLNLNPDGSRAFIPEREKTTEQRIKRKKFPKQMDFISLSDDPKPNRKRRIQPLQDLVGTDDEPEEHEAMNIDDMFMIDKRRQDVSVHKFQGFPVKQKIKKQNPVRYFPYNIKTVRSNPGKATKRKKKQKIKC